MTVSPCPSGLPVLTLSHDTHTDGSFHAVFGSRKRSFVNIRVVQQAIKKPYDKCLFTLFSSDETSEGQLLLDVDDFIEGGNEIHRETMKGFYDKYRCGKAVDLRSRGHAFRREACRATP